LRVVFHNVAVLPINVRLFPENNKKIRTYFVKYQLIDRIQETLIINEIMITTKKIATTVLMTSFLYLYI